MCLLIELDDFKKDLTTSDTETSVVAAMIKYDHLDNLRDLGTLV